MLTYNEMEKEHSKEIKKLKDKNNKLRVAAHNIYIDMIEQGYPESNELLKELGFALGYKCIVCGDQLATEEGGCCVTCLDF